MILFELIFYWTAINQLKEKMQELNMYRSLLLQQIGTIKMLCANKEESQVIFIGLLNADECAYSL